MPDYILLQEKVVDFFESQVRRLWVTEVDDGYKSEVGSHEYQVCFPLELTDQGRGDHDDKEVPDPIGRDPDRGAFCPDVKRQNLGNIHPGYTVHGCAKEEHVLS